MTDPSQVEADALLARRLQEEEYMSVDWNADDDIPSPAPLRHPDVAARGPHSTTSTAPTNPIAEVFRRFGVSQTPVERRPEPSFDDVLFNMMRRMPGPDRQTRSFGNDRPDRPEPFMQGQRRSGILDIGSGRTLRDQGHSRDPIDDGPAQSPLDILVSMLQRYSGSLGSSQLQGSTRAYGRPSRANPHLNSNFPDATTDLDDGANPLESGREAPWPSFSDRRESSFRPPSATFDAMMENMLSEMVDRRLNESDARDVRLRGTRARPGTGQPPFYGPSGARNETAQPGAFVPEERLGYDDLLALFRGMLNHRGTPTTGETYEDFMDLIERMGNVNRSATDTEINSLPTHQYKPPKGTLSQGRSATAGASSSARKEDDESEDIKCSICLGDYEPNEEVKHMLCGHMFHSDCLDRWLKINRTCPICKQSLRDGDGPSA